MKVRMGTAIRCDAVGNSPPRNRPNSIGFDVARRQRGVVLRDAESDVVLHLRSVRVRRRWNADAGANLRSDGVL